MSKPNGRQRKAIENLAKALRPPPPPVEYHENLAAALNECFEAATEAGEQRIQPLVDAQKETLKELWAQRSGNKENLRLPIDD